VSLPSCLGRRHRSGTVAAALVAALLVPGGPGGGVQAQAVVSPASASDPAVGESWSSRASYLWQSASGHLQVLRAARPVEDWLADPATPQPLRERLQLTRQMRDFAVQELALPDNASYRRYADVKRAAVVWNVVAAPELSLRLQTWCFPVVGCVGYRGYHEREQAYALAQTLKTQGFEVYVYGVPAYSTLGRLPGRALADPLLNTFIFSSEVELARLMFHELAHQVAYASDDTMFNESFATAVGRLGADQWVMSRGHPSESVEADLRDARRSDFNALTARYRDELQRAYGSTMSDEHKRQAKADILARLQADYRALRDGPWNGFAGYDSWFEQPNNARFGVLSAYYQWQLDFERLFQRCGRHYERFYADVRRLAGLSASARQGALASSSCEAH